MAKVRFKRIEIVSLIRDSEKIMSLLQKKGAVQLERDGDNNVKKLDVSKNIAFIKERLSVTRQALYALKARDKTSGGLLKSFEGRPEIDYDAFFDKACDIKKLYGECLFVVSKQKEISELKAKITKDGAALEAVKEWEGLSVPTSYEGTKHTRTFVGYFKSRKTKEQVLELLKGQGVDINLCFIDMVSVSKEQTKLMVTCHRQLEQEVMGALFDNGFSYPFSPTKHPPSVRIKRLSGEIKEMERKVKEDEESLLERVKIIPKAEYLIDYLSVTLQKFEGLLGVTSTRKATFMRGYAKASVVQKLKEELEGKFACFVEIGEIEGFEPSALKNGEFSRPVEPITEMYALPGKGDVDPTPIMSFFYYLFFGMMLSDAGYGVVMIIASALILKKKRPEGNMKKTLKMFLYCGVSTLFWGALFGGWFGDIAQVVGRDFFGVTVPSLAIWYEPIKNPMSLLLLSFLLGILHLFLGYIVRFNMVKEQEGFLNAAIEVFPTMMLIVGVAPLAAGILVPIPSIFGTIGSYLAIAAVLLILFTNVRSKNILKRLGGGIYGLYNIASGSLSDVLSYSRLLALGLATGSIANVVNLMGSMPSNIYAKGVMLFAVFFVGHALNLAINMLGSYVHTNRLQFVELFSKFYEGGGERFRPIKADTEFYSLKVE